MVTIKSKAETAQLEQWRVALENAETQNEVAESLAELGYDTETIAAGKTLLAQTREVYDLNQTEDDETTEAYKLFQTVKAALAKNYRVHRKKAKVVFLNDDVILRRLALDGKLVTTYIPWLETIKKFYAEAADSKIIERLARLKITADDIAEGNNQVAAVEEARAAYLREVGESQNATKEKDNAMAKMQAWMSEFYSVARIALEDNPQLLEVLGKPVKS